MRSGRRDGREATRGEGRRAGAARAARAAGTLLAAASLLLSACWLERDEGGREGLQASVEGMLSASAAEWNRGDLDGFLDDYLQAPSTTFVGSSGLIEGFEGIRDLYAPRFAPGAERDSLRFEAIRTRQLGPLHALATARWVLHRGDSVTASGPFTLVLRRASDGWRILHDHSSSDPAGSPPAAGPPGAAEASGGDPPSPTP